jgi:DNA-binding beta-propeller fold protein YncE
VKRLAGIVVTAVVTACAPASVQQALPMGAAAPYDVWVASEAVDQLSHISFDGSQARVVAQRPVGSMPVEPDGPHGVAFSPDGRYLYVTLGHGMPNGWLWKIDLERDVLIGKTLLSLFPATVAVTPDGVYGFVSNFNLHGDHVPSSISVVHLPTMAEIARTQTCVMPHGSRVNPQGTRHYSVCMMDDLLVELEVGTGLIERMFSLRRGMEGPAEPSAEHLMPMAVGAAVTAPAADVCSPTWAEPSADGSRVFVTCNKAQEVLEIDVAKWAVVRRFTTGESPYNLAVTADGRLLLVSLRNRTDPGVDVFDLRSGGRVAHVPSSTTLAHGVAVTADSRFAFISVEGVGAEPGKVDIVDLTSFKAVASVEVGQQATGIAVVP